MTTEIASVPVLTERVEKLERQNRRVKQAGAAVLILAAALVLMGQAPATRTVEASEFVLKDAEGKVLGRFGAFFGEPGLHLYDSNGKPRATLQVFNDQAGLSLFNSNLQIGARLQVFNDGAHLAMGNSNSQMEARLRMFNDGAGLVNDGAGLELSDREGFRTTIGNTELVTPRTGETHQTSAASVVLFDKDKNVLWKAP